MECNRDEATRAKVIAEKKFEANDIKGAKRFALKAKSLYPELEGIQQMLSTLEVYIAAETKISEESDWYAILGVDPAAVEITIRKHYKKLALLLHPDKNKCIGAEGAFKLISESWSVLSNKAKRSTFDQKRKFNQTAPQKAPTPPPSNVPKPTPSPPSNVPKPTPSPRPNGFPNFTKSTCPNTNVHNKPSTNNRKGSSSNIPHPSPPAPAHAPFHKENTSFWIGCPSCLMKYEYLRVYLHHNLRCPNCQKHFYAKESNTAPCPIRVANQKKYFEHKNPNNSGNQVPFSGTGVGCGSSGSAQAASMVQKAYEQMKRKWEEAQAEAEAKNKKNHTSMTTGGDSKRRKVNGDHEGKEEAKKGISELFKVCKTSTTKGNQDNTARANKASSPADIFAAYAAGFIAPAAAFVAHPAAFAAHPAAFAVHAAAFAARADAFYANPDVFTTQSAAFVAHAAAFVAHPDAFAAHAAAFAAHSAVLFSAKPMLFPQTN